MRFSNHCSKQRTLTKGGDNYTAFFHLSTNKACAFVFWVRRGGVSGSLSLLAFFGFGGGSSCCFSGLFFVRLFPVSSGCGGACCCWRRRWFSAFVSACRFRLGFRWLFSSSVRSSSSVCLPVFAPWFGRRFSVGFVVRRGFPVVGGGFRRRRLGSGVGVGVASGGCVFRRRRFPVGSGWSARRRLFRLLSVGGRVCCCSRGFLFLVSRLVPVGLLCSRLSARAAGRTRRFIQRKEK